VRQEAFINRALGGGGHFLPEDGCPGPGWVDVGDVRIIAIDTMFWLYMHHMDTTDCPYPDQGAVTDQLEYLLASSGDRHVIVVGHHPLATHGTYGGFYDWKDHLFPSTHLAKWLYVPTPLVGSLYPLLRSRFIKSEQSLGSQPYQHMIEQLTNALATHPPLIYAAGHDHGLQVLKGRRGASYLLVSALGLDKAAALSHGGDTLFAHLQPGFMAVDITHDRRVLLRVIEPPPNNTVFQLWLNSDASVSPVADSP